MRGAAGGRLTDKVCPHTGKAGEKIFILGKFHLQLTFPCLGTLGENVKNQAGAIQNLYTQLFTEDTHLGWCELIVEDSKVALVGFNQIFHLFDFTLTDKAVGVGRGKILHDESDRLTAGSFNKGGKLIHTDVGRTLGGLHAQGTETGEHGTLFFDGGVIHRASR